MRNNPFLLLLRPANEESLPSPIHNASDNENFLGSIDEEFIPKRYGTLEDLKKERSFMESRIYHIKMKTFDAYFHNFQYLLQSRAKYDYYLIFHDNACNFHIQVRFLSSKYVSFEKIQECEFLKEISEEDFLDLMEEKLIDEMKINIKEGINFRARRPNKLSWSELFPKIWEYGEELKINVFYK